MKILIISDLHLDPPFEDRKFRYLKNLFSSVDQIILNGDFWEGFAYSFDDFYNSSWNKLFPILKNKNAVYVFGNHDKKSFNDLSRLKIFAHSFSESYKMKIKDKIFYFEHGHRLWINDKENVDTNSILFKTQFKFMTSLEELLIRSIGSNYQKGLKKINDSVINQVAPKLKSNEFFFFGHTHRREYLHDLRVYNSGVCKKGLSQYLILKDDEITSHEERY
jgi:predicted phosphodiesterase